MKKNLIKVLLVLSLVILPLQAISALKDAGYISVNTNKNMEVEPDTAEISFSIKSYNNKSMQVAKENNKLVSQKVISELKTMINDKNGDFIKTSNFSANPIYSYKDSKKIFEKYEVSNTIIVKTKSLDEVGKMIDSAITSGATNVQNLSFSLSNYETQCNKLIVEAVKSSKTRAKDIATALGTELDGVKTLDSSCSTNNYNIPRVYMAKNMMMADGTASNETSSVPIEAGTIKLNANINATYYVTH